MMNERYHFTMKTTRDGLLDTINRVNALLEPRQLPNRAVYVVNLVFEEILTNIIKYGFDDDAVHDIEVRLEADSEQMLIEFEDDGREFDPLSSSPPLPDESLLAGEPGGRGLLLVTKMANSVKYRRENEKNILTVGVRLREI